MNGFHLMQYNPDLNATQIVLYLGLCYLAVYLFVAHKGFVYA